MNASIKEKIIGTWKLLSWVYYNDKNEPVHYFGKNIAGILMYDKNGHMNAQLTRMERPLFRSAAINGGTFEEVHAAFSSYLAYYENRPGELVHAIEGSLFPNWTGDKQIRYGSIENNTLTMRTPPILSQEGELVFHLTWMRIA